MPNNVITGSKNRNRTSQLAVTLAEFQSALTEGWVVDPPVQRKRVPDRPNGAWYCDVILWREGRVKVLTVPDDAALRQFLAARDLKVTDR
jgi:hypothetical protein